MLQATLSLDPSLKIRSFFVNPIFTNFVFHPFVQKIVDPTTLQHILHSRLDAVDDSIILNPSQQEAVDAINSLQSTVAIHGPGGTGKTFVASEALARRDYSHASKSPKDITLFAATTNVAALNIAMALSKRSGMPHFRLIVSRTVVSYYSDTEREFYNHLCETDHIWDPGAILEASKKSKEVRDNNKRKLKGSHILIGTVSPQNQILINVSVWDVHYQRHP